MFRAMADMMDVVMAITATAMVTAGQMATAALTTVRVAMHRHRFITSVKFSS